MNELAPPSKMQPALIGGVILGVLSAVPFVNALNCLCCLWVIAGGVVAGSPEECSRTRGGLPPCPLLWHPVARQKEE